MMSIFSIRTNYLTFKTIDMKTLFTVWLLVMLTMAIDVVAQQSPKFITKLTSAMNGQPVFLTEGENTIVFQNAAGTLKFVKSGDTFSNVAFTDPGNTTTQLASVSINKNGVFKLECKSSASTSFFRSANGKIWIYFCKSDEKSSTTPPVFLWAIGGGITG